MSEFIKKISDLFLQKEGELAREHKLEDSSLGLGKLPERLLPDKTAGTICGYCSTGCSLDVHIKSNKPVNLTPSARYPVNMGKACPKGWEALTPLGAKDRATVPLLYNGSGKLMPVTWDVALRTFVKRFKSIQRRYGMGSTAFISTGQISNEEMALLGAVAKFGMGFLHGDGNTRQCMASAVVAYKQSFGFDAPPYTYKDFEESDVLIFIGANPCMTHPIMWGRVYRNEKDPKIIVIDPRKTETACAATRHYALNPKTDIVLFYGIANILIKNDWIDKDYIDKHTNGFEGFKEHVRSFNAVYVSSITGLPVSAIMELASIIHEGKNVSFWWTMGVNQSYQGVRTAQSIINLSLMTGNIGRPGTGPNSITGQCNAMGSRLFSNTTSMFSGYDFLNDEHREKMASLLNIDKDLIPDSASLSYDKIVEGISRNKIKGLWIIATNPVHSWINKSDFRDILDNLEFLVVQDMYYSTDTAQIADLVLPAAGCGEKEGTFINSERRFGLLQKVSKSPGRSLADFYIFKLIADYWGCGELFKDWETPEDVFQILKKTTVGTPCDISGIKDYKMIYESGGIQWPYTEEHSREPLEKTKERRLFEDGKFYKPDGKAVFMFEDPAENPEPVSNQYPFILLTGRASTSQWHTETRTEKSEILKKLYPENVFIEINPEDAKKLNIEQNQWVIVTTRRGRVKAEAFVTPAINQGQLFMPMHYIETNKLTFPAFDTYSRQPSYKICAANIAPITYYEAAEA